MGQPYIGEIRMFGGNFNPSGWALCNGQLMAISENDALFALIGTIYGGDGQTTFAMPDLRGRVPIHQGVNLGLTYVIGEQGGAESVTLTSQQMPTHSHSFLASTAAGSQESPENNVPASSNLVSLYSASAPGASMAPSTVAPMGGSQPHENMQPFLCVNYIIALFGIFPPQN